MVAQKVGVDQPVVRLGRRIVGESGDELQGGDTFLAGRGMCGVGEQTEQSREVVGIGAPLVGPVAAVSAAELIEKFLALLAGGGARKRWGSMRRVSQADVARWSAKPPGSSS
ncbi:hypothetical protein OHA40_31865 [Nocardia sp. NBC_00508]|uniref:hypothetical protein n=1 Tax=Nocardia sp. NBC_00508 TaxID=2975992 RepID=UPI002E808FC4|nr:hypothetical protein [Nocardia sp. NBC_00508]WUD66116.1 hypothetical protein OHA40_31865 [Nocardia sp. NBC_00508]